MGTQKRKTVRRHVRGTARQREDDDVHQVRVPLQAEGIQGGEFNSRFTKYDVNKSGDIGIEELTAATREYLGQPATEEDKLLLSKRRRVAAKKKAIKKKEANKGLDNNHVGYCVFSFEYFC